MRSFLARTLIAISFVASGPAMAEKMGSTTHVYKDGRPKIKHLPLPNNDALKGWNEESVAKLKLCYKGGGMFKSGGKWVNGRCRYPDGTSWN
jgi:hypothetical protein